MTIVRTIIGIPAGVVAAGLVVAVAEWIAHILFAGDALFGAVAAGYGLAAMAGTVVATTIAGPRAAVAIPLVVGLLAAINLASVAHPVWFAPAALGALALGWYAGSRATGRGGAR